RGEDLDAPVAAVRDVDLRVGADGDLRMDARRVAGIPGHETELARAAARLAPAAQDLPGGRELDDPVAPVGGIEVAVRRDRQARARKPQPERLLAPALLDPERV